MLNAELDKSWQLAVGRRRNDAQIKLLLFF